MTRFQSQLVTPTWSNVNRHEPACWPDLGFYGGTHLRQSLRLSALAPSNRIFVSRSDHYAPARVLEPERQPTLGILDITRSYKRRRAHAPRHQHQLTWPTLTLAGEKHSPVIGQGETFFFKNKSFNHTQKLWLHLTIKENKRHIIPPGAWQLH